MGFPFKNDNELNPKEDKMKKYIFLTVLFLSSLGMVNAQDTDSESGGYKPEQGDFSAAVLFGRGNFLNAGLDFMIPSAPGSDTDWTVAGTAPYNNTVEPNSNDVSNIVGVELRYFLADNMALKLSGGGIIRNTPARDNIPGYIDANAPNATWIPAYAAVEAENRMDMNVNLGGEYLFETKNERVFPYVGVTVPFYYSRKSMYDPTIGYISSGTSGDPNDLVVDIGTRHVEMIGFGGQLVCGIDYYLMEGLYFGFEVKPASYVYAYNVKMPAPGLEAGEADNHTFSFFSQTFVKVGFGF